MRAEVDLKDVRLLEANSEAVYRRIKASMTV